MLLIQLITEVKMIQVHTEIKLQYGHLLTLAKKMG